MTDVAADSSHDVVLGQGGDGSPDSATDAPVTADVAPDAAVTPDAPDPVDAPTARDAAPDAPLCGLPDGGCGLGLTMCGDGCKDLSSDTANCGVCGRSVGTRTYCFEGQPSDEMSTASNPGMPNDPTIPQCDQCGCTCRDSTTSNPCVLAPYNNVGVNPLSVWACTC